MSRTTAVRKYGKKSRKPRAEALFAELPPTPVKSPASEPLLVDPAGSGDDAAESKHDSGIELHEPSEACADVDDISKLLDAVTLEPAPAQDPTAGDRPCGGSPAPGRRRLRRPRRGASQSPVASPAKRPPRASTDAPSASPAATRPTSPKRPGPSASPCRLAGPAPPGAPQVPLDDLEELTWEELLADCAKIEKIGEASYAEVYRITAADGAATSVLKAVRLEGHPIKAQTAAQVRSGLVDEQPHAADEAAGELRMAEWLADIPGFLVYKARYLVRGRATRELTAAHQAFHRREKRRDPDRLQWYPSPTRYLEDTRFLVMEVADAGKPLEGFKAETIDQVWDILLLTALALARGEDVLEFEHRDLHEGNICVKQARPPTARPAGILRRLGYSGVDVTLLDYGLSRVTCPEESSLTSSSSSSTTTPTTTTPSPPRVLALDLEQDLSLFQSTHAPHAVVYRQMRSFLVHGDPMAALDPDQHLTAYPEVSAPPEPAAEEGRGSGEKLTWTAYAPYTNVLWLAHLYETLTTAPVYAGGAKELKRFRAETEELWACLDPRAPAGEWSFGCAGDVIRFAIEEGWVEVGQVEDRSFVEGASLVAEEEEEEEEEEDS
ncbi:hypothetical protein VTJ83DRAFT_954 [Remersonia thermophila]|uniref:non-specific serine/threonine protein kinase n=1 Tax=Remersonia thermophila TaxID=72144 RepID=A0ABR4DMN3_9PEZI